MKRIGTCSLTGLFLICAWSVASGQPAARRIEDVVYGRKFGMALTMDVFQPATTNGCGILFLVNGGWLLISSCATR